MQYINSFVLCTFFNLPLFLLQHPANIFPQLILWLFTCRFHCRPTENAPLIQCKRDWMTRLFYLYNEKLIALTYYIPFSWWLKLFSVTHQTQGCYVTYHESVFCIFQSVPNFKKTAKKTPACWQKWCVFAANLWQQICFEAAFFWMKL